MEKRQDAVKPRRDRGQAALEFAITLMATLLLIFGLIEFGRATFTASVVQWAAQAGARAGIVDTNNIVPAIQDKLVSLDLNKVSIVIEPDASAGTITVTVSYPFEFVVPIIAQIAGDTITFSGSASMIVQPFVVPSP